MKELSIEQKAKAYDEALERAKEYFNPEEPDSYTCIVESIFPELKESEDEKIRKELINAFKEATDSLYMVLTPLKREAFIAWLEKQDKHTTDKVEHKFHKGDWIVHHVTENIYQVVAIIDNQYQLKYGDTYTVQKCADVDRCARLWDIAKDAKDGDILVDNLGNICIYQEPSTKLMYHSFCYGNHKWFIAVGGSHRIVGTCPATKEQSNLLFQKMKEAGYKWDAEKKGLKKIEPSEWNEDKSKELSLSLQIQAYLNTASDELYAKEKPLYSEERLEDIHKCMLMWQKLHNAYFYQKPTWSEEDKVMLDEIIDFFENGTVKLQHDLSLYASWLKSLRPQSVWKPSEEQIQAVKEAACYSSVFSEKTIDNLISLSKQLKKLREEDV